MIEVRDDCGRSCTACGAENTKLCTVVLGWYRVILCRSCAKEVLAKMAETLSKE